MTKFISVLVADFRPTRLIGCLLCTKAKPSFVVPQKPTEPAEPPKEKDLLQRLREAGL